MACHSFFSGSILRAGRDVTLPVEGTGWPKGYVGASAPCPTAVWPHAC